MLKPRKQTHEEKIRERFLYYTQLLKSATTQQNLSQPQDFFLPSLHKDWASKMALLVMVYTVNTEDLNLIPGINMVKGETHLSKFVI